MSYFGADTEAVTTRTSAVWNSGTAGNTTLAQSTVGYGNVGFTINVSGTITGGVISFEVSDDGGATWFPIVCSAIDNGISNTGTTVTLATSLKEAYQMFVGGYTNFRLRLSTTITGSGNVTVAMQMSAYACEPWVTANIVGVTTGGGGGFVNVKVNPSGALSTASNIAGFNGIQLDAVLGAAKPANVLQVGGNDGTNAYGIPLASAGASVLITPGAPTVSKYSQAAITFSASGANILVAGVGGQTIRVYRIFFVNSDAATATNITIQDTTPTSFSGAFRLASGGSFGADGQGDPLWITATGKGFQLNSSAAVQVSGTIWYTQS